jgi:UDP-N-acetylmuramate--alanine ligase
MTTEALATAGLEPTGVAGGRVGSWGGNLRFAGQELFVVEADEYDRSFLALTPTVAVINNIEADHLDIYRDLDDIRGAFTDFARRARFVVANADDPEATALPYAASSEVLRFGIAAPARSRDARLVARNVRAEGTGSRFDVVFDGKHIGELALRVPGAHNVRNALAAVGVGLLLGASLGDMRAGLERFGGVERRFQRLGAHDGIDVVDDYAHHPTEVEATLQAARGTFPMRRIIAAFQPHLFSRTRDFATDFARALGEADVVFLADIYPAREQPIPGVTADLIADAASARGRPVAWRGTRDALAAALEQEVRSGDVVLTLGAGDITRTGPELLERLGVRT